MSHTTTVSIELRDRTALAAAVEAMGGTVLQGNHHYLFAGTEIGFGFTLPNWRYPLCLHENNTLAFDDYGGSWGRKSDLEALKGKYAIAKSQITVQELGWLSEIQADGNLLIFHPDGGTFTVTAAGVVDSMGFVGSNCDVAAAIENALGAQLERTDKAEYYLEQAHIHTS